MIILSVHIRREMVRRGVTLAMIEQAVASPDLVTPDRADATLTRSFAAITEMSGRALRVVHRPEGDDIFIVTAHWDRGAKL